MVVAIVVDGLASTKAIVPLALGSPIITLNNTRARASASTNATKTKALVVVYYSMLVVVVVVGGIIVGTSFTIS
jgi:hypothetical protein